MKIPLKVHPADASVLAGFDREAAERKDGSKHAFWMDAGSAIDVAQFQHSLDKNQIDFERLIGSNGKLGRTIEELRHFEPLFGEEPLPTILGEFGSVVAMLPDLEKNVSEREKNLANCLKETESCQDPDQAEPLHRKRKEARDALEMTQLSRDITRRKLAAMETRIRQELDAKKDARFKKLELRVDEFFMKEFNPGADLLYESVKKVQPLMREMARLKPGFPAYPYAISPRFSDPAGLMIKYLRAYPQIRKASEGYYEFILKEVKA